MDTTATPPKPLERFLRATAYACIGLAGVWLLIFPPPSISTALGHLLTIIWSCFLLSALPAVVVTLLGRYRVEYWLLPFFGGALSLAVLHEWINVAAGPVSVSRALFDTALLIWFAVRFVSINQLVKVRVRGGAAWTAGSK